MSVNEKSLFDYQNEILGNIELTQGNICIILAPYHNYVVLPLYDEITIFNKYPF